MSFKNKEAEKEYKREWFQKNKERNREWYLKNKE
jgi:hypothetical protein